MFPVVVFFHQKGSRAGSGLVPDKWPKASRGRGLFSTLHHQVHEFKAARVRALSLDSPQDKN